MLQNGVGSSDVRVTPKRLWRRTLSNVEQAVGPGHLPTKDEGRRRRQAGRSTHDFRTVHGQPGPRRACLASTLDRRNAGQPPAQIWRRTSIGQGRPPTRGWRRVERRQGHSLCRDGVGSRNVRVAPIPRMASGQKSQGRPPAQRWRRIESRQGRPPSQDGVGFLAASSSAAKRPQGRKVPRTRDT